MAVDEGVKLLPDLNLQSKNAYAVRKFWDSDQDNANNKVKISLVQNIMGSASSRILMTLTIPDEDRNN
ncbi:hypothetical protein PR048_032692 [Dryococelus australis]|uniref:Uncharacterized protein n=1 Tax=Dryococelus australis TaxID=614101 RepID=A0ABQ9G5T0_9NEOP|nr:hypothetical protein PR048_032692 [Dryococelus australis]